MHPVSSLRASAEFLAGRSSMNIATSSPCLSQNNMQWRQHRLPNSAARSQWPLDLKNCRCRKAMITIRLSTLTAPLYGSRVQTPPRCGWYI